MTLQWPENCEFTALSLEAVKVVARTESPFTLERTTYEFPGERWYLEASIRSLRGDAAEDLMATILKMRQIVNPVSIPIDNFGFSLKGNATGSIKIDGADQVGRSINLKGAPVSETVFKRGDYINIGTRLHKILDDTISDGSGNLTVSIWPAVTTAPADEDLIEYLNPAITVNLEESSPFSFSTDKILTVSIKASEVI